MYKNFLQDIERMNKTFELPVKKSIEPDQGLSDKVHKFHKTLSDEVNELLLLTEKLDNTRYVDGMPHFVDVNIDHYVELADLLGDIVVYCASEAQKHGIYLPEVLEAIMASQWSKLGANGEVIKDDNGKVLKGENYQPPEPTIKKLLQYRNRMVAVSSHRPYEIPEQFMGTSEAMGIHFPTAKIPLKPEMMGTFKDGVAVEAFKGLKSDE